MPFYEYECRSCRYYLEVMQKISDAPLRKCPSCGRMTLRKLVSAPVFRLKGSGWYETDFKSAKESKRNLAGSEREDSKPAEAPKSPAPSADSTPAAKPAAPSGEGTRPAAKPVRRAAARASGARPKAGARKSAAKRLPRR